MHDAIKKAPEETPSSLRIGLLSALFLGLLLLVVGPSLAILWGSREPVVKLEAAQMFDRLEKNERVQWLLRLIPYNEGADSRLSISALERLGPPKQQFSFVAPYEDLVGYKVSDVIQMMGQPYNPRYRVSAIVFPLEEQLYPANARGLLQVISEVEARKDIQIAKPFLREGILNDPERDDLKGRSIVSYRFDNHQQHYRRYCELAHQFRCDRTYTSHEYIGGVAEDWHPLGFSEKNPDRDPCRPLDPNYCATPNLKTAREKLLSKFGSRVFLIRNLEIQRIPDRTLLEFAKPSEQLLPDLRFRTTH
jgi:hypothetical protein